MSPAEIVSLHSGVKLLFRGGNLPLELMEVAGDRARVRMPSGEPADLPLSDLELAPEAPSP